MTHRTIVPRILTFCLAPALLLPILATTRRASGGEQQRPPNNSRGIPGCLRTQALDDISLGEITAGCRTNAPVKDNWGSGPLPDLVLESTQPANGPIRVTAIPSLAGAVASVTWRGTELIATGGHGASFQYAIHPYYRSAPYQQFGDARVAEKIGDARVAEKIGDARVAEKIGDARLVGTECDNPTEAGSKPDDAGAGYPVPFTYPYLYGSSTAIVDRNYLSYQIKDGHNSWQMMTKVNLAYYVPENVQSDYAKCDQFWKGDGTKPLPGGLVSGTNSNFILQKWVTLGAVVNNVYHPNILKFDTTLTLPSERSVDGMDVTLVAYLSRALNTQYYYDPRNDRTILKGTPLPANWNNLSWAPVTRIYASTDGQTALGVVVPPNENGAVETYNYSMNSLDDPCNIAYRNSPSRACVDEHGKPKIPSYDFTFRNLASKHVYGFLAPNATVESHSTFIIGTVSEIKKVARAYCQQWKLGCADFPSSDGESK